jgi:hypothetical protein
MSQKRQESQKIFLGLVWERKLEHHSGRSRKFWHNIDSIQRKRRNKIGKKRQWRASKTRLKDL